MTSRTYAEILKQQFSLDPTATTTTTANNHPPCKRQATVIDYDSDQTESQSTTTAVAPTNNNNTLTPSSSSHSNPPNTTTTINYATELLSLKNKIQVLQTLLTNTVEQIKNEIASIRTFLVSGAMEIDATHSKDTNQHYHQPPLDLPAIIADLKHDIATTTLETQAMFQKHMIP